MVATTPARSTRWHRCILALMVVCTCLTAAARPYAQELYGSIVGVVKDDQGGILPGAAVVIVNRNTGLRREAVTNAEGGYTFTNVLSGPYDVRITMSGFREALRSSVPVTVGQISRVDAIMQIGGVTEVVEVTSEMQLLQTDKADTRTELKPTEITNLPLNQYRNYQTLLNLVPGSQPGYNAFGETLLPQGTLNIIMGGQDGTQQTTRNDGTNLVNAFLPAAQVYIPPVETIESVNVVTGSMDAESGGASGAAISVTTKSGTNQFRGSAFGFYNAEKLNATPYYFGRGAAPRKLPIGRQTFGGTLGGPLRRNHLFFFGSYEGYFSQSEAFAFYSVPDAALRRGDFSNAVGTTGTLQRIYDPMSANLTGATAGRQQFANNVIPANRIHPIARKILDLYYPMPNVEGTGAGGLTNNYQEVQRNTTDRHNFDFKLNWNRTGAHQIWGKVSQMDARINDRHVFPFPTTSEAGARTKVWNYAAGQTWTLGPKLTMDSSIGVATMYTSAKSSDTFMGMLGLQTLGIPGTNDQGRGDERYAGLPRFNTGFSAIGDAVGFIPTTRDDATMSGSFNITKFAGQHELKSGYTTIRMTLEHWNPEGANPRGQFSFAGNATRTFGAGSQTADFYNTYAAFLLGLVGSANRSIQHELFTVREWQHAAYFRDRWNVNPKLTLDLGMRWEYYPIMNRANRGMERLDLDTLEVLLGGVGGNPRSVGLEAAKDHFAPRIGGVYRVNDHTVLRSGYGLAFESRPWAQNFRGHASYPLAINANFDTPAALSQFGWYGTLEQGIPLVVGPDTSSGRVPLPNTVAMTSPSLDAGRRPRTHSWNVAFERRVRQNINVNAVRTLGGGAIDRPYFASFGRQLAISVSTPYAKRTYHALQIGVNRPMTKGLLLKGHYTFSRGWFLGTNYELQIPEFQERNWQRQGPGAQGAAGIRDHNVQLAFVYQLPWTSAGPKGLARRIINDWQVSGVLSMLSGEPFTVTADGTLLNTPGNTMTADLAGTLTKVGKIGADGVYYDPAAFAQPTCALCLGNTYLNQFTGPGVFNLDLSVLRSFPLGRSRRLEARVDASNVTDTPKFGNPTSSITSGDFMRVFSLNPRFTERQVRLSLRFSF
jgi:carboxypeptidase family protein/TonB-dependent receptor-like protein